MGQEGRQHLAGCATGVIENGRITAVTYRSADVSLDEAADLADDLAGGPYIVVSPRSGHLDPGGLVTATWDLLVMTFIPEELPLVFGDLQERFRTNLLLRVTSPAMYRLRGGELV
jgi:hypothetical protein